MLQRHIEELTRFTYFLHLYIVLFARFMRGFGMYMVLKVMTDNHNFKIISHYIDGILNPIKRNKILSKFNTNQATEEEWSL